MLSVLGSPDLAIDLGTATTRVAGGSDGFSLRPSTAENVRALNRGVIGRENGTPAHAARDVNVGPARGVAQAFPRRDIP